MTTFQDPPLQSRRSVRQSERDSAVVPTTGPTPTPVAPDAPGEPLTYATQGRPTATPEYEGPSFRARRTPDPVGDVPADAAPQEGAYRPRDYSPEGRRSAAPAWAPQYGGAGQPPVTPAEPPVVPADPASTFAPHAPAEPVVEATVDDAEAVEHTLTRRELRALRDAHGISATTTGETVYPTPEQSTPAQPVASPAEIQDASPAEPAAPAAEAVPVDAGTPLAAPSTRLDSALAEFDQLAGARPAASPDAPPAPHGRRAASPKAEEQAVVEEPVVAEVVAAEVEAPADAPAEEPVEAPVASAGPAQVAPEVLGPEVRLPDPIPLVEPPAPAAAAPQVPVEFPVLPEPVFEQRVVAEPVLEQPVVAEPVLAEPVAAEPEPVAAEPEPEREVIVAEVVSEPAEAPVAQTTHEEIVEVVAEPSTSTPPTGHWTTQAQLDDETQFGEEKLARNIGATSGAVTTSALVLPSIPDHEFGPLTNGDGMVTGSISLPASMSATGAHPAQLDESDLDHLLDPGDHQVANTDSQPVRAIKAVSTHTSPGGVIGTVKPKGTKGLTALIIAATGMAVVVGALFIVLIVTGQLG